jgi:uncharacterized membrane protein YccC
LTRRPERAGRPARVARAAAGATPGRRLLFSLNTFAAALIALYVAFSIGLPRPYWAMATAYIVSQPLSGALRSKGVYRLVGTIVGGAMAVALLPTLGDAPPLLCFTLALWVGLCLYVSLLDRTPRSYVFILAGYTAAIIGFPAAPTPGLVFITAVARVEEIGLGVISATLVHTLVAPQGVGPVLVSRINTWLKHAQGWTLDALAGRSDPGEEADRRRLAVDATEIRILSTHLPFDTTNLRDTTAVVRALQDRMTLLLPLISAVGDRLAVLRAGGPLAPGLQGAIERTAAWGADPEAAQADAERLRERVLAQAPALDERAGWGEVVQDNLVDRLSLLIALVQDVRDLRASLQAGERRPPRTLVEVDRARRASPLHRDRRLAVLSATAAIVAVLLCCVAWIGLGWTEGSLAAMNAAVFCSFFATQDDPAPAIRSFLWFTVLSVPVVALYQFAILPKIDGFVMLAAALAPVMIAIGYFVGDPRYTSRAMPVALGVSNGLALAETFTADFAGFANSELAQVIGLIAALMVTRVVRSVGVDWSARRILRAGWRELARMAAGGGPVDRTRFTVLMLDRAGLLVPRLALAAPRNVFTAAGSLGELRVGLNLDGLQRARRELVGDDARDALRRVLDGLARYYQRLATSSGPAGGGAAFVPLRPPSALLEEMDAALASVLGEWGPEPVREGVRALVGLRRTLFPDAPPYAPPPPASVP